MLVAVTLVPEDVNVALQPLLICWLPGQVQLSRQLLTAVPVSLITICPWKPPGQELTTEKTHDSVPAGGVVGGGEVGGGLLVPPPEGGNWMPASSDCSAALTGVGA